MVPEEGNNENRIQILREGGALDSRFLPPDISMGPEAPVSSRVGNAEMSRRSDPEADWAVVTRKSRPGHLSRIRQKRSAIKAPAARQTLNAFRGNRRKDLGTGILCWGSKDTTVAIFWRRLARPCNQGAVMDRILKVVRIVQKDRTVRFDTYCLKEDVQAVTQHLHSHQHNKWGWCVRTHIGNRAFGLKRAEWKDRVQEKNVNGDTGNTHVQPNWEKE